MGSEVNINPFGYDNYKDFKKDLRNTKDEDGIRLGSSRSEYGTESIFSKEDSEVTKEDFLSRLDELGLDDDMASAAWEILNIDTEGDSLDVLDSSEIDKLIQMYGDDINIESDDEVESVSLQSFSKYLGNEKDITNENFEMPSVDEINSIDEEISNISLNDLDSEKYSTDKINKDKDEILGYKSKIDSALEKIKNGEVQESSNWGNGLTYYNIELKNGERAYVRYENGSIVSCDIVKVDRWGQEENLSHSTFDQDGNMNALYLDKDKSSKAEKSATFKDGNLSTINYDDNENNYQEAVANFENNNFTSIKISKNDNGAFDKEFTLNESGQYQNAYNLDTNGERIVEQPLAQELPGEQQEQQVQQQPTAENAVSNTDSKGRQNTPAPSQEKELIKDEGNTRTVSDNDGNILRTVTYEEGNKTTVKEADGSTTIYETENGYYKTTKNGVTTYTDENGNKVNYAQVKGYTKIKGTGLYKDKDNNVYEANGKLVEDTKADNLYTNVSDLKRNEYEQLQLEKTFIDDTKILTAADARALAKKGVDTSSYQKALRDYNNSKKSSGTKAILAREANALKKLI